MCPGTSVFGFHLVGKYHTCCLYCIWCKPIIQISNTVLYVDSTWYGVECKNTMLYILKDLAGGGGERHRNPADPECVPSSIMACGGYNAQRLRILLQCHMDHVRIRCGYISAKAHVICLLYVRVGWGSSILWPVGIIAYEIENV